jgi:hypothetical protein
MALEQELETFARELPALLRDEKNRGRFALVHKDKVESTYASMDKALAKGYEVFGVEPFLVKEVTEHEQAVTFFRSVKRCPS